MEVDAEEAATAGGVDVEAAPLFGGTAWPQPAANNAMEINKIVFFIKYGSKSG